MKIYLKRGAALPTRHVPDAHASVLTARGNLRPVAAKRNSTDVIRVALPPQQHPPPKNHLPSDTNTSSVVVRAGRGWCLHLSPIQLSSYAALIYAMMCARAPARMLRVYICMCGTTDVVGAPSLFYHRHHLKTPRHPINQPPASGAHTRFFVFLRY